MSNKTREPIIELQPVANWELQEGWVRISEKLRKELNPDLECNDLVLLKIKNESIVTILKDITKNYNRTRTSPLKKKEFDKTIIANEHYREKLGFKNRETPISIEQKDVQIKKLNWFNPASLRFLWLHPNLVVRMSLTIAIISLIVSLVSILLGITSITDVLMSVSKTTFFFALAVVMLIYGIIIYDFGYRRQNKKDYTQFNKTKNHQKSLFLVRLTQTFTVTLLIFWFFYILIPSYEITKVDKGFYLWILILILSGVSCFFVKTDNSRILRIIASLFITSLLLIPATICSFDKANNIKVIPDFKQYEFEIDTIPNMEKLLSFIINYDIQSKKGDIHFTISDPQASDLQELSIKLPGELVVINMYADDKILKFETKSDKHKSRLDYNEVNVNIFSASNYDKNFEGLKSGSEMVIEFEGELAPNGRFSILPTPVTTPSGLGVFMELGLGRYACSSNCFMTYKENLSYRQEGEILSIIAVDREVGYEVFTLNTYNKQNELDRNMWANLGMSFLVAGVIALLTFFKEFVMFFWFIFKEEPYMEK